MKKPLLLVLVTAAAMVSRASDTGNKDVGTDQERALYPIPVQQYAVINITKPTPEWSFWVSAIALDDQNNVAYGGPTGLYDIIDGKGTNQYVRDVYNIYTWKNGLTSFHHSILTSELSGASRLLSVHKMDQEWVWPLPWDLQISLTPAGTAFGNLTKQHEPPRDDVGELWNTGYRSESETLEVLTAPRPPYAPVSENDYYLDDDPTNDDPRMYEGASRSVTGVFHGGSFGFLSGTDLHADGSFMHDAYRMVVQSSGSYVQTSASMTIFDDSLEAGVIGASNTRVVKANFRVDAANKNGWAVGRRSSASTYEFVIWNGETKAFQVLDREYGIAINAQNDMLIGAWSAASGDRKSAYLLLNGTTKIPFELEANSPENSPCLIPPQFRRQLSGISPHLISNRHPVTGDVQIVFEASSNGEPTQTFVLTKHSDNSVDLRTTYQYHWYTGVNDYTLQNVNANGVLSFVDGLNAYLLLPVKWKEFSPNSGFDEVNFPPWIMVPQYGNNFARLHSPAKSDFAMKSAIYPEASNETCSPLTIENSPQVITVNGKNVGESAQVRIGVGSQISSNGQLLVDVKPYQYKYVMLHQIVLSVPGKEDVYPLSCPSAQQLENYLNNAYGKQTNTFFHVGFQLHHINYDQTIKNGVLDVAADDESSEQDELRLYLGRLKSMYDFDVYFVRRFHLYYGGKPDSSKPGLGLTLGYAFYLEGYTVVEDDIFFDKDKSDPTFSSQVIGHEIGHLFGLLHANINVDIRNSRHDNPAYLKSDFHPITRFMYQHITPGVNKRFVKQEWDIVNPNAETNTPP